VLSADDLDRQPSTGGRERRDAGRVDYRIVFPDMTGTSVVRVTVLFLPADKPDLSKRGYIPIGRSGLKVASAPTAIAGTSTCEPTPHAAGELLMWAHALTTKSPCTATIVIRARRGGDPGRPRRGDPAAGRGRR
jgi:hypothetical protein